ncbi:hypothetical protein E6B08_17660 [Pseudomonas putida]|uniref:Uncharacterized protein n=1 Tax=Pseudomonas putida TaxID=303 RepID=A0A4D6XB86_PSEPU|nr:hypothetical protein [Pseudomonas putida]NWC82848.1 hypothetical protein [Pseudomonas putida]QCI13084.1 hypothetical protein E6B08_17660 [Pseudomonas putida]
MPLPFRRKPGLGHYKASRSEWYHAYRAARVTIGRGLSPDHTLEGVQWKAQLIVAYERDGQGDLLRDDAPTRLSLSRLLDEMLADERGAQG